MYACMHYHYHRYLACMMGMHVVKNAGEGVKVRLLDGMDEINVFIRKILESGDDGGVTAVRKAIDLYLSCVNTPAIDSLGAKPMLDLINSTGKHL